MNEEWFGICAKGATNINGVYKLYPRAAYYALKKVNKEYAGTILNKRDAVLKTKIKDVNTLAH